MTQTGRDSTDSSSTTEQTDASGYIHFAHIYIVLAFPASSSRAFSYAVRKNTRHIQSIL